MQPDCIQVSWLLHWCPVLLLRLLLIRCEKMSNHVEGQEGLIHMLGLSVVDGRRGGKSIRSPSRLSQRVLLGLAVSGLGPACSVGSPVGAAAECC